MTYSVNYDANGNVASITVQFSDGTTVTMATRNTPAVPFNITNSVLWVRTTRNNGLTIRAHDYGTFAIHVTPET